MRHSRYTDPILTVIAILLAVLAFRPLDSPSVAGAQPGQDFPCLYVEPGTTVLRKPDGTAQSYGKIIIDLRSGDLWGFPTLEGVPYPVDRTKRAPPVSEPMYLGKFDFSKMRRN